MKNYCVIEFESSKNWTTIITIVFEKFELLFPKKFTIFGFIKINFSLIWWVLDERNFILKVWILKKCINITCVPCNSIKCGICEWNDADDDDGDDKKTKL